MDTNPSSTGMGGPLPEKLTHDLNNVLASILCYATLLRRDTKGMPSASDSVSEIVALTQRARQMLVQSPPPETDGNMPLGRGERILLVDDEHTLVSAVSRVLRGLGYQVTGEHRSVEARNLFLRNPYAFDLLIADQTMPEMTGLDLAAIARNERPNLPVILTTGYSARLDTTRVRELGIAAVVEKPATSEVFASTLRRVLDSRE